jgi:hypothetical protein
MRVFSAVVAIFLLLAPTAQACTFGLGDRFTEVARTLSVAVSFEGRTLGVTKIAIHPIPSLDKRLPDISPTMTTADGTARLRDLPPGKYRLEVSHLGISAAFEQIEVKERASSQAKPRLEYRWGAAPTLTRQVSGRLTDTHRPKGLSWLERVISKFQSEFPIVGASIQLRHPTNGSIYHGKSDAYGKFDLTGVPVGTYVMQIGGAKGSPGSENFLIRVTPEAAKDSLQFVTVHMCGGEYLELVP